MAGNDLREIITFEPEQKKVSFLQASGTYEGVIINELFEDTLGALQLRFYCYLGLRGEKPNGSEEQAQQAWMEGWMDGEKGFKSALQSTLNQAREFLLQGKL